VVLGVLCGRQTAIGAETGPKPHPSERSSPVKRMLKFCWPSYSLQYFGTLGKQKPTTARNYARARRLLEQHLGKDRTLESITEGDADGYKRWLLDNFAVASSSVDLRRARQFLKAAVRRRLIPANPVADVPCGPQANES
jgi:hypothetical protein